MDSATNVTLEPRVTIESLISGKVIQVKTNCAVLEKGGVTSLSLANLLYTVGDGGCNPGKGFTLVGYVPMKVYETATHTALRI